MQNSCLLCISTLLDGSNHYSKMFELTDAVGNKIFESFSITLVCDECLKSEHPEKCTHKLSEMPRWLSSKKMDTVRALLSDDPAMLLRESMGISADSSNRAFPSDHVERFMKNVMGEVAEDPSCYYVESNTNHVVIAVDPAGGGSSQFAVFSLLQLYNGAVMCLGADALRTKDVRETHKCVLRHIEAVRKVPRLQNCMIVLVLESNLGFECQHIVHAVNTAKVRNWVALSEGASGGIGWLTTNERKESMCFALRDSLAVGCIGLSRHFFSTTHPKPEIMKIIDDELKNFCILVEAPKTPFGKPKKTYSGKIGGRNDDIAIVMQLAIAGVRRFYQNEKYAGFRPVL